VQGRATVGCEAVGGEPVQAVVAEGARRAGSPVALGSEASLRVVGGGDSEAWCRSGAMSARKHLPRTLATAGRPGFVLKVTRVLSPTFTDHQ
jgi:hypothetical protein